MVAGGAAEGAAVILALGLISLAISELGGNAQCLLLGFEVGGVEYIAFVVVILLGLACSGGGTRFEYLLGTHETLAAARVGAGFGNLLGGHELAVAGLEITAPEGTDAHAHQLLDAQTEAGEHLAHLTLQTLL